MAGSLAPDLGKQDNLAFRVMFTLPPAAHSLPLAVQELPPVDNVTGDTEVDAVLWLHQVIETGSPDLIARANEALKRIKTPMKTLENRYNDFATRRGRVTGTYSYFFGFGQFDHAAERAIEQTDRRREGLARFGTAENLFADQPAETACKLALRGLKTPRDDLESYDEVKADQRFVKRLDLTPHTLADCLHARAYWQQLYWLRHATEKWSGDGRRAANEHDWFCLRSMGRLKPRNKEEALAVLEYAYGGDLDHEDQEPIMRNLVAGGWQ